MVTLVFKYVFVPYRTISSAETTPPPPSSLEKGGGGGRSHMEALVNGIYKTLFTKECNSDGLTVNCESWCDVTCERCVIYLKASRKHEL